MKGTLFSADFIKDSSNNLRLLEVNTDTGFIANTLNTRFDFTEFITILSSNNISEVVLVYKDFQQDFADMLESDLQTNASFITSFTKQLEDTNSIYPAAVIDSDSKFILRLAYDENALFDSTYAKDRVNLQKLFYDNSATGSIPEFYFSGSDYEVNTISDSINSHATLPDFVTKDKTERHQPLKFIKLGNSSSSSIDRVTDFIDNYHDKDNKTIEVFHFNSSDISDNKVSGYRRYGIVYGDEINYCSIGGYRVEGFFNIPTTSQVNYITDSTLVNTYSDKHYFELTSNWLRTTTDEGIYKDEIIITGADGEVITENVATGSLVKSMFINGLPDTDDAEIYRQWSHVGSSLPTGSYITSSIVETVSIVDNDAYGVVGEITLGSEKIYSSIIKNFLVYSTGSNEYKFLQQYNINADDHFLIDANDNKIAISENNIAVLEDYETGSLYKIDVETTDSYFISSSQNAFVVHNAPCFVAGTLITLGNGEQKMIEDVEVGDEVTSFNFGLGTNHVGIVEEVMVKENEKTITYHFDTGNSLTGTPDHPLYVKEKEWCSFDPEATLKDSGFEVGQIEELDFVKLLHEEGGTDGYIMITRIEENEDTSTVYNLSKISINSNFFANDVLVHNRVIPSCCFRYNAQVQMIDGTFKNISEIEVGEQVISYNESTETFEAKQVTEIHDSTKLSDHVERNAQAGYEGIGFFKINGEDSCMFTPEHPFLTDEGWKAIVPDTNQEPFKTEQEPKILEVGDFIQASKLEEVFSIEFVSMLEDEKVYNITVEDNHNYIVSGYVVHNK